MRKMRALLAAAVIATGMSAGLAVQSAGAAPIPAKAPAVATDVPTVHPGAFCAPENALGKTVTGLWMKCKYAPGDSRLRWRVK